MTELAYAHPMQEAVAVFHRAFGHPDNIATPGPLAADRINLRLELIREEGVNELRLAYTRRTTGKTKDPVEFIDAFIDTAYVAFGTLVEMGLDYRPVIKELWGDEPELPAGERTVVAGRQLYDDVPDALARNSAFLKELELALQAGDLKSSQLILSVIIAANLRNLERAGEDPTPYFNEIQRANMSKLGADGKPVRSRGMEIDGYPLDKILKGPNYTDPDLTSIYFRK